MKKILFLFAFLTSLVYAQSGVDLTNRYEAALLGTWMYSSEHLTVEIVIGYDGNPHGANITGRTATENVTYRGRYQASSDTITFHLFSNMHNNNVLRFDNTGLQAVVNYELKGDTLSLSVLEMDSFASNLGIAGLTYRRVR